MLLWDCDLRAYSYYVEVSVNNIDWVMVADKTKEECRSWQLLRFKKQPVVFIRIVGILNTANEVSKRKNFANLNPYPAIKILFYLFFRFSM
jgi:BTB/POZ domain-containing protein 9